MIPYFARAAICPEGFESALTLPAVSTEGIEVVEHTNFDDQLDFINEYVAARDSRVPSFFRRQAE